jgi:SAM-dependent methyltransferase
LAALTVCCPRCAASLDLLASRISCQGCGQTYPRLGQIPVLLPDPDTYLALCRRQLAALERQIASSERLIEAQLQSPDTLPLTKARCRAVVNAARHQLADIGRLLHPLFNDATTNEGADRTLPTDDDLPSLLTNVHYLFRDWGWPPEAGGENERTLAAVEDTLEGEPMGLTVVLGAGGCRLAYDLHSRASQSRTASLGAAGIETFVVDIDPLLLAVAHEVIRGATPAIHESYADLTEIDRVETRWELAARRGAAGEDRFHFLIADGLNPPFSAGVFDTVITPWFIDVVPTDLGDAIGTAHRLLKPGGRWVNVGALGYTPDVPVSRRYTREELFDLTERAGFQIGRWAAESMPSLVSKHTGRGKVEWVLTFAARKTDADAARRDTGGPPAWLLFRHLPIPVFPGQSMLYTPDPLARFVADAIDGSRSLDDLVRLVAVRMESSPLSRNQIREAVRRCLAEVHPACGH